MRPSLLSFFLFAFSSDLTAPCALLTLTEPLDSSVRLLFVFSYLFILCKDLLVHHVNDLSVVFFRGGYRIRTDDPLRARQVL